jgi:hypothetical protein
MRLDKPAVALVLALSGLTGCAAEVGDEEDPLGDVIEDGKDDSLSSPTQHNEYFFGTSPRVQVEPGKRHHAWQFALSASASVKLETFNADWRNQSHSVLYVYRKTTGNKWRLVEKADGPFGAHLDLDLKTGTYRIILKGQYRDTNQLQGLDGTCEGDGCPDPKDQCIFNAKAGASLSKLNNSYVEVSPEEGAPFSADQFSSLDLDNPVPARIIEMAKAISSDPFADMSLEQAFAVVDGGLVSNTTAIDTSNRQYDVYTFKLAESEKPVTAIFDSGDDYGQQVAMWFGNENLACRTAAPICAFGHDLETMLFMGEILGQHSHKSTHDLDQLTKDQIALAAIYTSSGGGIDTAEEALEKLEKVDFTEFHDVEGRRMFTVVTFGQELSRDNRGEEAYGLVFEKDTMNVVAMITAGDISRCSATQEAPRPLH